MKGNDLGVKLSMPADSLRMNKNGCADVGNAQIKNSSIAVNKTDSKVFYNNLSLPINKDTNQLISRSIERCYVNGHCDDLGVNQEQNDGTDSGVEVIHGVGSNGSNSDRFTPIQSCGSSLVSYSSEPEIDRGSECGSESSERSRVKDKNNCASNCWKSKKTYVKTERSRTSSRKPNSYENEGTSESCSETSSTHEAITPDQLSRSFEFKRCSSSRLHDVKKCDSNKLSAPRRSESVTRSSAFEKPSLRSHSSVRAQSSSSTSNAKSHSGVSGKCEIKGSKIRNDEGRWSSSQRNQTPGSRPRISRVGDTTRKSALISMTSSLTSAIIGNISKIGTSDVKSNALDKYGTLPRRPKKKSVESLCVSVRRSNSVSREPSLNRAATLRNQKTKEKENLLIDRYLPPYPKVRKSATKTIIYHEVSVQTVITSKDISNNGSGVFVKDKTPEPIAEKGNKSVQTEGKDRLKKIEEDFMRQREELEKCVKENEQLKAEKRDVVSKICKLLGRAESMEEVSGNGLEELEQHFQAVGLTVMRQQEELSELRRHKVIAHRDLEKSLAAQKSLIQQQQEIEEEYSELQEFLQAEKTALSESLLDTEEELKRLGTEVAKKQSLLEQQQEECKHLVRICEQRRQENLSLEAKLAGLDQRSRDVLVQQGAAVSAAAVALSGLGARLDTLVEQLSVSCNITEKDIEEAVYHNEAYPESVDSSPCDAAPKFLECPKRRESFLQVILGAIKNATHSPFSKRNFTDRKETESNPEGLAFFDAESEPCLNFESDLEGSSASKSDYIDISRDIDKRDESGMREFSPCRGDLSRSDSLQNLSDAILNRQLVEKNERRVSHDEIIPIEFNSLVDQIIDVDNLVTKLLKVIRVVQGETERCVEELQDERAILADQLYKERLNQEKLENSLQELQQELVDARSQLNCRITQLEEAKALCGDNEKIAVVEMQKRFALIDSTLGALNSVQDTVNKCPPLAQLRQDLQDCTLGNSAKSDVNANSASNGNAFIKGINHGGAAVLTTAI